MSARSAVMLLIVAFAVVIAVTYAQVPCGLTNIVHSVSNLCQIYSNINVASTDNNDDNTHVHITGPVDITFTVTNQVTPPPTSPPNSPYSQANGDNQFWCNQNNGPFATGTTPSTSTCSWANGETTYLGSSSVACGTNTVETSTVTNSISVCGLGTTPSLYNMPKIPIGAIMARIGGDDLPGFASATSYDWRNAGYFQLFCQHNGVPGGSGDSGPYGTGLSSTTPTAACDSAAISNAYGGEAFDYYSSPSVTPPTFEYTVSVPSGVSGDIYLCYNDWQNEDNGGSIQVSIEVSGSGAAVCGDPQFSGLRGQTYQIHGVDGAIYNVISDAAAQVNARFSFLDGPRKCPIIPSTNKTSGACWSHPGSYLSEVAVYLIDGTKIHIQSGPAAIGFNFVTVDNSTVHVGSTKKLNYMSTHELRVIAGPFVIELENVDGFVNLRSVTLARGETVNSLMSHGLLGQTWKNKRYDGRVKEIEGDVDDYVVNSLFDNDFIFNQFVLN